MFPIGIFLMLIAVGLVPVGGQLVEGGTWGAAPSIGMLFAIFGAIGLLERALRPPRRRTETIPTTPAAPGSERTHVSQ